MFVSNFFLHSKRGSLIPTHCPVTWEEYIFSCFVDVKLGHVTCFNQWNLGGGSICHKEFIYFFSYVKIMACAK